MTEKKAWQNRKIFIMIILLLIITAVLFVQLAYVMIFQSDYYSQQAEELHNRDRKIKALRGEILDCNGVVLASNKTVCTVSVIHSQIKEPERVIDVLTKELGLNYEDVKKRVDKVSSIEKIKTNVDKNVGDTIRSYGLEGVKVDEDYKRFYPYSTLASKVLGFTGADNQGILGLEVKYDGFLSGKAGKIKVLTDANGVELKGAIEQRVEPEAGMNLETSIDYNIQMFAQQLAEKTMIAKEAKQVCIIVMRPDSGEIVAMVNVPEYDLNAPYELNNISIADDNMTTQKLLNAMWRNFCVNDTYEPGSTFKMITATAALETKAVTLDSCFTCTGSALVEDRRIRCARTQGHGAQSFAQTVANSCNPAFIEWGRRVGVDNFYSYMDKLGVLEKTGIDLPGEAGTIVHKKENVGPVELATMSFGQSFQITPMQMLRATCAIINGGTLVTPHFAVRAVSDDGNRVVEFEYDKEENVIDASTSATMRTILQSVVDEGGGSKAQIEGYEIGGKTATSEKLPRGTGRYIASFIGFAPANNPEYVAMCLIDEPSGTYYGGMIAAPVVRELFENMLPNYLALEN